MRLLRLIWLPLALVALIVFSLRQSSDAGADVALPERVDQPAPNTPVLSARRLPATLTTPGADAGLQFLLASISDRSPSESCLVASSATGRRIFQHNGDLPLVPASTNKMLTAVALLSEFGPEFRFTTTLATEAPIVDGVVSGDLYIIGGGDPILSTDEYVATFPASPVIHTDFEALADQLVSGGVTRITGGVVGDDTRYDDVRYVDSWPDRFREQGQSGPLSALAVDDGFTSFPAEFGTGRPSASSDPASHAASELASALESREIVVESSSESGVAPTSAQEVASVDSPPLSEIVTQMLSDSDNTTAELLVKELGRARSGSGNTDSGTASLSDILAENGIDVGPVQVVDGSGLADENRLTCNVLVDIMELAGPESTLADGLAVSGQTGTLRERFVDSPAAGRIRAKTGTLSNVTALAGYADSAAESDLLFAFIINGAEITDELLLLQEELGAALIRYPEGPIPSEVGPLPVS